MLYSHVTCVCCAEYTSLCRRVKRVRCGVQMWGFIEYRAPHSKSACPSRWDRQASLSLRRNCHSHMTRNWRVRDSALGSSPAIETPPPPRPRHTLRPGTPVLLQTLPLPLLLLPPRLLPVR